ncbi:threonine ammonia-lyase [Ekhidna sp.]
MRVKSQYFPRIEQVKEAAASIKDAVSPTPLMQNMFYSSFFKSNVMMKREDLQLVRSYKIRGALNKVKSLDSSQLRAGLVCASAGNHAQGVAYACAAMNCKGTIYMPVTTPSQKVSQVQMFGGANVEVVLLGDTFDEAKNHAINHATCSNSTFIHPFDDEKIIEGQATIALELLQQSESPIDYLLLPIGGGGLAAGVGSVFKSLSPSTVIIGVEPAGAPSMKVSLERGENVKLEQIEKFVDGAAVQQVGKLNFDICQSVIDRMLVVHEGKICETILNLYNRDAIVVEPAGALTLSALEQISEEIVGKNVVCIVSGSNNDITRTEEIKERALLYKGLKHYFVVPFPQRAGALKEFVVEVLGPNDDITHFEYTKKNSRETGSAVVGIELKSQSDLSSLVDRMKRRHFYGEYLNDRPDLLDLIV